MKLNSWFEMDDKKYCWYILQGYEIVVDEKWVEWYLNSLLHKTDGPAVIRGDGTQYWFLNGTRLTEEEWERKILTIFANML